MRASAFALAPASADTKNISRQPQTKQPPKQPFEQNKNGSQFSCLISY
jgi:hypothetical protein